MNRTIEDERKAIQKLNNVMIEKLALNQFKPHWNMLSNIDALVLLKQEVIELENAILHETDHEVERECADIANYCMFIIDNIRRKDADNNAKS